VDLFWAPRLWRLAWREKQRTPRPLHYTTTLRNSELGRGETGAHGPGKLDNPQRLPPIRLGEGLYSRTLGLRFRPQIPIERHAAAFFRGILASISFRKIAVDSGGANTSLTWGL